MPFKDRDWLAQRRSGDETYRWQRVILEYRRLLRPAMFAAEMLGDFKGDFESLLVI